ncbi:MAG: carboxymuconolactone decarboxylase family protein [Puniceicoccales bacterium]
MTESDYSSERPPPNAYQDFKNRFPAVVEAYEKLGKACHWQGPLDPKARELVKLGIAIGAGLEGATHAHVRLGLKAGASPDEIRHAALLATTTLGFPTMMRSMSWIEETLRREGED